MKHLHDNGYCHICHLMFGSQEPRTLYQNQYVHQECKRARENLQAKLNEALEAMPSIYA